jgi:hypothetical protein
MASHSPEADAARARAQLYRLRKQDTAFAALWDDALEEAADWLELEALRRAAEIARLLRG